ncbi:MAG: glycosyltransferase family 4 protein [Bacteroidota bacterium]
MEQTLVVKPHSTRTALRPHLKTTARKTSNKPLTVAIVLNTAWNIYNFRLGLAKHLMEAGHRVIAIAPPDAYVEDIEKVGCHFYSLPNLKRKGTNPFSDLRLTYNLYKIYRTEQVDVVLHYTVKPVVFGTLAAKLAGVKAINTLTGLGYAFISDGFVSKIVRNLYRVSLRFSHKVLFQNRDDRQLFLEHNLVSKKLTGIVHGSGINTDRFKPSVKDLTNGATRFLFIGRLLYDKGVKEFIEAAKQILNRYPNAQFHVIGELDTGNPSTIDPNELKEWRSEGIIRYHGRMDDVRPHVAKCDALVLPSYREGLPRVMLEGMSMAKPLIATDVPGCRETVEEGRNGFLVKVKDSQTLFKAMEKMILMSKEERRAMGNYGRHMALERFDERQIVKRYLTLIEETVKK